MEYNLNPFLTACLELFNSTSGFIYYMHIPPVIIALFFSAFLFANKRDRSGILLSLLSLLFSLFVFFDLIQWMYPVLMQQEWSSAHGNTIIIFSWSLLGLLAVSIFYLTHAFVHSFITDKNLPLWMNLVWVVILLPIFVFTPTVQNVVNFDIANCQATQGTWFTNYYYLLGVLAIILISTSAYTGLRARKGTRTERPSSVLVATGACLFILAFLVTGAVASYLVDAGILGDFGLDQYGIAAMTIFIGTLVYATVRYHAFNLKLIAAQALVFALVILIASELLFVQNVTNRVLVLVTLGLAGVFGLLLVRSVKAEIRQREQIQQLAEGLRQANEKLKELDKLKSQFLSIASHDLRAPLTAIRNFMSLLLDGTYGKLPSAADDGVHQVFDRATEMAKSVENYLNVSRIEQGRMQYDMVDADLAKIVTDTVDIFKHGAEEKGLALTLINNAGALPLKADVGKLQEVFNNLVDNSIKYTPKGSIAISIDKVGSTARVVLKDTGVGMSPATIAKLFQLFSPGENAKKTNASSTGVGLYITKAIVEAHKGKVWAESDGEGKGSRFIVELPLTA